MKYKDLNSGRLALLVAIMLVAVLIIFAVLPVGRAQFNNGIQGRKTPAAWAADRPMTHAEVFPTGIHWVGAAPPPDAETLQLAAILAGEQPGQTGDLVERVEAFLSQNPISAYAPSLHVNLGYWHRGNGRVTKALEHWSAAWQESARFGEGAGKVIADHSMVQGARLLSGLGRLEELEPLVEKHRFRVMSEPALAQIWARTAEAAFHMRAKPGIAYRCGTYALNNVSYRLTGIRHGGIFNVPSTPKGFSLAELSALADAYKLGLVAAFRSQGADFLLPAVVHWKQNHYAAMVEEADGRIRIEDPTFLSPSWISVETLEQESSGYFLVPSSVQLPQGWRRATAAEMLQVFGRGYMQTMNDDDGPECVGPRCEEGPGGSGTGSGASDCGLATWKVLEPNINLEISDTPMSYDAAFGPDFVLHLAWRQRNETLASPSHSHFSSGWESDLHSYLEDPYGPRYGLISTTCTLYWGNGYVYKLNFVGNATVSDQNPTLGMWAVRTAVGGIVTRIDVYFRNGSVDVYDLISGTTHFRLASRKDATGQALAFTYDDPDLEGYMDRLTRVTTADGAQFNFSYTDGSDLYRITSVTGPNSRSVSFAYSAGVLSSITDVVGITSSFGYDTTRWWVNSLVTPYGTNSFTHFDAGECLPGHPISCEGVDRYVIANEPGGSRQVYAFYDNPYRTLGTSNPMAGKIPTAFASSQLPQYLSGDPPIQTLDTIRDERNSHYWNRQQAALLSTLIVTNLTAADYLISRARHWLRDYNDNSSIKTLGWELPPSQDGSNEVQPVFYDYPGKDPSWNTGWGLSYTTFMGTSRLPSVIAQRRPEGTYYEYLERNSLGMKTKSVERWIQNSGVTFRTNNFAYASGTGNPAVDNLLMVEHKGPYGEIIAGRALHATYPDQIGRETNAVGEVTIFNYDSYRRLTSKTTPAGLVSTHTFNATNYRLETLVDSISGVPLRTNSFTWLNGYMRTHTDPRNFLRTFDYDFLGRLTQITYSDGSATTETFAYALPAFTGFNNTGSSVALLDLVTHKDRLGNYSRTLPNRIRQTEKIIEPSRTTPGQFGTETTLSYCGCGSPTEIVRGWNTASPEQTSFDYNYQGAVKKVTLPNLTTVTNLFDTMGRLSIQQDALMKLTNTFDNLNRLIERRNGAGLVEGLGYNLRDRILASTNSNGVISTNQYDAVGRVLIRGYPDGGKEQWSHALGFAEPARYTNQIGNITTWAYDAAQRRTNEIAISSSGAPVYTNAFNYAPAGDLRELFDGKSQKTAWGYNSEGQITSKTNQAGVKTLTYAYDANGRAISRWTAAKGTTSYTYDGLGNRTLVNYPSSADITLQYSALSRLTNIVDASGTTQFAYNTAGDVLTEDGPFPSDVVTYGYHVNVPRLRTSLSLQQPAGSWTNGFSYDAAHRLNNVTSQAGAFTYTYSTGVGSATAAAAIWKKIALPNTGYITNAFDTSGRLTETSLRNSGNTVLNRHSYLYNSANQGTNHTRTDSSYVRNTYDPIGQLRSASGYTSGGTPLSTEQKGYAYDAAWNLNTRTNNGVTSTFAVNVKNELTSAPTGSCAYDANGNITSDGGRSFSYDDENQLTSVTYGTTYRHDFVYDGLGRLRKRIDYSWTGSSWYPSTETTFIYHGMNIIQERAGGTPSVSYTRGWDLGGSFEGAGGIGGMLARSHGYSSGTWSTHHGYHADSTGNITAMVDSSQLISASYRYDSFGNLLSSSGAMAGPNICRFSSKLWISNPGIYYYGFRFYEPNFQRWLNQDPLGEEGGVNLCTFVYNDPNSYVDPDGQQGIGVLLQPPPVGAPPRLMLPAPPNRLLLPPPRPHIPPNGMVENPFRPGSWGWPDKAGKFTKECWRFDKGQPGKPLGSPTKPRGGSDHLHFDGLKPKFPVNTPWPPQGGVNAPPTSVIAPPGVVTPTGFTPTFNAPKRLPPGTVEA